jgi:hypothetical protein
MDEHYLNQTKGHCDETDLYLFPADQELFINYINAWAVPALIGTCPTADSHPNCE